VTSSPGVLQPVRRSVRHAGFEGPLSAALVEHPDHDSEGGPDSPGWAVYIASLERFRKDLKQIHTLELEMARVKRDREILVTRLIKNTKSRPTKSDLSAMATNYGSHRPDGSVASSRASVLSMTSNGSTTASKEGKRASKLQDAQAELLGCEEHLRSLEVRIEHERNKVMMRGLEERFRAMEAVGRMWVGQGKKGLADIEKMHGKLSSTDRRLRANNSQNSQQMHMSSTRTPLSRLRNPPRRSLSMITANHPNEVDFRSREEVITLLLALSPAVLPKRTKMDRQLTKRPTVEGLLFMRITLAWVVLVSSRVGLRTGPHLLNQVH
jgi:hypothetical protein